MKIIIKPMIWWFSGALVLVYIFSSYWAMVFSKSLFYAFIEDAFSESMFAIAMALIGTVIQSLFIKMKYFYLGAILSILAVSIATMLTWLICIAIILEQTLSLEFVIEELLDDEFAVYMYIFPFLIPCLLITTVVYIFTRPSNTNSR